MLGYVYICVKLKVIYFFAFFLVGLVMLFIVLVIVDFVSIGVREGFFSFLFFFWFCGFVGTFFDMFLLVLVI